MQFGKLHDLTGVDFTLPPDHPQTAEVLAASLPTRTAGPQIYVGATGWSNPEWSGTWYPPKTRPADFLKHYSQQFGTIEFNTTHYRIPDADLVYRWAQGAAPGFKFCPKVPQQISHYSRLGDQAATTAFCTSIIGLGDKLGPTFIQLPDTHGPAASQSVLHFARQWPRELPLHWEFRHPEWFQGHPAAEATFAELAQLGQGTVITDVAGRRDVLHMRLTNAVALLRFVGNSPHPSDMTRLQDWVARLRSWKDLGLRELHIFVHQHDVHHVPPFALHWGQQLQAALGSQIRMPKAITPPPPPATLFG